MADRAKWTAEEDAIIQRIYAGGGRKGDCVLEITWRSARSVQKHIDRLYAAGLLSKPSDGLRPHWTDDDEQALIRYVKAGYTRVQAAVALDRTVFSCEDRLSRMRRDKRASGAFWRKPAKAYIAKPGKGKAGLDCGGDERQLAEARASKANCVAFLAALKDEHQPLPTPVMKPTRTLQGNVSTYKGSGCSSPAALVSEG